MSVVTVLLPLAAALAGPPIAESDDVAGLVDRYMLSQRSMQTATEGEQTAINGQPIVHFELRSQVHAGQPWTHELALVLPRAQGADGEAERAGLSGLCIIWVTPPSMWGDAGVRAAAAAAAVLGVPCAVLPGVPAPGPASPGGAARATGLEEQALVAASLRAFAATGDPDAPLPIPMACAVAAAASAIESWSALHADASGDAPLDRFVVVASGIRAWGALVAAGIDHRIAGVMALGFDLGNLAEQPAGGVPALAGAPEFTSPRGSQIVQLVDPVVACTRTACPLWIVRGLGDPAYPIDSLDRYAWDLKVPFRPTLRADQGAEVADALPTAELSFLLRWADDPEIILPGATLAISDSSVSLVPEVDTGLIERARLWSATSATPDFAGATWKAEPMARDAHRWIVARPIVPAGHSHVALMGELILESDGPRATAARVTTVPVIVAGRPAKPATAGGLFLPPAKRAPRQDDGNPLDPG